MAARIRKAKSNGVPAVVNHRSRQQSDDPPARPWQRVAIAFGMLWTSPNTVLGLLLGVTGVALGARMRWQRSELALIVRGWPGGAGGALTLGNVIVHTGERLEVSCLTYAHRAGRTVEPPISLADHERAHVYQYMLFGPLFLPLYFLCGGVSARNPFERAADRYAQSGCDWWPWPRRVVGR
jgi:hypothetical protein